MIPTVMAPTFGFDFVGVWEAVDEGDALEVEGTVVWVMVVPPRDRVTVNVGGWPVASGPAVAEMMGEVAVAPPKDEPPMADCTASGIV